MLLYTLYYRQATEKHYFTRGAGRLAPLELTVGRTLRFSEVDALAIAWHGHYLRFFEEAHSELMRKIGLSYERYFAAHIGAPVAQAHWLAGDFADLAAADNA